LHWSADINRFFCREFKHYSIAVPVAGFTADVDFLAFPGCFHEHSSMNSFVLRNLKTIEMTGVLMRIFSFSLVSWLGPQSPFMFIWVFNTIDAVMLTWCATLKRDRAYITLNGFWILVGIVGILRAGNILH
jgi:hypothetical protein